ncbi:MAG TPA: hypothetical protein VF950_08180 [Planctomycetota bacterium]
MIDLLLALSVVEGLLVQDVVIERTVTTTTIDSLGRRGEVRRRERIAVRGKDVAITDLTFGERMIIRSDLRRVWRADPMAGTYSELSFDDVAALRKASLDELLACKARVPGTSEEKELAAVLEGLDRYEAEPAVELRTSGAKREIVVNGDRVRLSAEIDASVAAPGYFEALGALGAFHPAVAAKLKELGGFPVKGTFRYALFMDRVIETFDGFTAKAGPAPAAEFEPPAGLAKVPLKGLQRAAERKPTKPSEVKKSFGEDDGDRKEREAENKP